MNYTSGDFNTQQVADYRLQIALGKQTYALAVIDSQGQLKRLASYDLGSIGKEENDILGLAFDDVKIAVGQIGFSLLPNEVFDENQLSTYSYYLKGDNLGATLVSGIEPLGIKILCQIDRLGIAPLLKLFPQARVYPSVHVLLSGVAEELLQSEGKIIGIDVMESMMSIYHFDSGKIIYFNDFEIINPVDFNYYLLKVLEGFQLNPGAMRFVLSGDITVGDTYYKLITDYGFNVSFVETPRLSKIAIPSVLEEAPHRFHTLLGLNVCA